LSKKFSPKEISKESKKHFWEETFDKYYNLTLGLDAISHG
jgi:hypothetical protein